LNLLDVSPLPGCVDVDSLVVVVGEAVVTVVVCGSGRAVSVYPLTKAMVLDIVQTVFITCKCLEPALKICRLLTIIIKIK